MRLRGLLQPIVLRSGRGSGYVKLEMFARSPRPGWRSWGNEVQHIERDPMTDDQSRSVDGEDVAAMMKLARNLAHRNRDERLSIMTAALAAECQCVGVDKETAITNLAAAFDELAAQLAPREQIRRWPARLMRTAWGSHIASVNRSAEPLTPLGH